MPRTCRSRVAARSSRPRPSSASPCNPTRNVGGALAAYRPFRLPSARICSTCCCSRSPKSHVHGAVSVRKVGTIGVSPLEHAPVTPPACCSLQLTWPPSAPSTRPAFGHHTAGVPRGAVPQPARNGARRRAISAAGSRGTPSRWRWSASRWPGPEPRSGPGTAWPGCPDPAAMRLCPTCVSQEQCAVPSRRRTATPQLLSAPGSRTWQLTAPVRSACVFSERGATEDSLHH